MARIDTGLKNLYSITDARLEDVSIVLESDPNDENGRSQWVWLRFLNGDLALATFPQGDTYFDVEASAEKEGD